MTSPPERPFSHYINSHRLVAEMRTTMKKKTYWKKTFSSCSFYLYRFRKYVSYGFPVINFCNPGVLYETPCKTPVPTPKCLRPHLANIVEHTTVQNSCLTLSFPTCSRIASISSMCDIRGIHRFVPQRGK